jgi:hypothetical protein
MSLSSQEIYEEALRRAGISTSSTSLTTPGFPSSYTAYMSIVSYPKQATALKRLIPHSQLARFEAEMHNIRCDQDHKKAALRAEQVAAEKKRAQFEMMSEEELSLFQKFKDAQAAKQREDEAAAQRKIAEEASARKEEQEAALQLFRTMLDDFTKMLYSQSDAEVIRTGQIAKVSEGSIVWPHAFEKTWREKRYKGKIEWHNYTHSIQDYGWHPNKNGREWDGWPMKDEVDTEVHHLLNEEWKRWIHFCVRYAERVI